MAQTDVASTERQARMQDQDQRSHATPLGGRRSSGSLLAGGRRPRGCVVQRLLEQGLWLAVVGVAFVAMAILVVYGTRRAVPLKYLMPGLLFLLALQVWPIVYTVATAFTNYGDGHRVSKQESVDSIIANSVREVPGTPRYKLSVAVKEGADIATGAAGVPAHRPHGETLRRRRKRPGGPARRRACRRRPPARSPRRPATRSSTRGRSTPARTSTRSPCPHRTAAASSASA